MEIHDHFLFNIMIKMTERDGFSAFKVFEEHLDVSDDAALKRFRNGDYSDLIEKNFTGLSYIIGCSRRVAGIICHSEAASAIISRDKTLPSGIPIHPLFHPVLDDFRPRLSEKKREPNAILIGSFGVPGGDKGSDLVIDAFRIIRKTLPSAQLIMAGYGAIQYVKRMIDIDECAISGEEPENVEDFMKLMRECDVAVQLRRFNRGESSGVLPQLVSLDVPTVASRVGALAEFGDAVSYVGADAEAEEIAQAILRALADGGPRTSARAVYSNAHSVEKFRSRLLSVLNGSGGSLGSGAEYTTGVAGTEVAASSIRSIS